MKDTFGDFIRKAREKRDLPIRKVASELDLDQSSLSKFERGDRLPPREYVTRFAKFFGVDEEELMVIYTSDKILLSLTEEKNPEKILEAVSFKLKYHNAKQLQQGNLHF